MEDVDAVGLGLGAVVEDIDGDAAAAAAGFCWLYWWNGLEVAIVRLDRGSLAVCVYPSNPRAGADRTERTNWGTAMVSCCSWSCLLVVAGASGILIDVGDPYTVT